MSRTPKHTCEDPDCSIKTDHTLCDDCWAKKITGDPNKLRYIYLLNGDLSYYHWERANMPTFMADSDAWKRRKVLKGNWSKP